MSETTTPTAQPTAQPTPAPPEPARRIFTATCVLGVPGSGKTSLFDGLAVYLWEVYRRVLLLYSWDGGAIPTLIQKRMKQGLIRFWRCRTRSAEGLGIETVYLATKGYWPRHINPLTGETSPAVELVAPVTASYALSCPKGHPLRTVVSRSLIVPLYCGEQACKQMIQPSEIQVAETVTRTRGFEQVGGVGYDGLTSMSNVVLEHMDQQRGAGHIGGEKPAFGGIVQSGSIKMGGNNRADVGFGQSRAQQFVMNSLSIPYLVEGPVFTALSMEASDDAGLSILGMKLPGRAATDEGSAWFGNVYEMGETLDDAGKKHFTLFLRPFTDKQGRRHLLKTSASPTGLPEMLIDPPVEENRIGAIANLGRVFRLLDEDLQRAIAADAELELPGIEATPSDYGAISDTPAPTTPGSAPATPATPTTPATPATPAHGIPPLQVAPAGVASPTPQAMPAAVAGMPTAMPRARSRRSAMAVPAAGSAPAPATEPPPAAVPSPVTAPPAVSPLASPAAVAAPSLAPPPVTGTAPPPPPGMRPPVRAPGS